MLVDISISIPSPMVRWVGVNALGFEAGYGAVFYIPDDGFYRERKIFEWGLCAADVFRWGADHMVDEVVPEGHEQGAVVQSC